MTCLVANNAYGTLVVSLDAADLTITLSEGEGSRFPSPVIDGEYFLVTVFDLQGQMEICKCTARDGDVLTVVRAQEGTTALSFAVGARVEHRFTAGMYTGLRDDVLGLLANKQNILTFDTTPTAGSVNPVTSGGIREAIDRANVPYAASAGTASTANYANSAGSVGGVANPAPKDVGAGGVGAIVFGVVLSRSDISPNGTVSSVSVSSYYIGDNDDLKTVYNSTSTYGGTWRNIGGIARARYSNMTMWQRIA